MLIKIYTNEVEGGWDPTDDLYASEELIVETARLLSERGHQVMVYNNGEKIQGRFGEVYYLPREAFDPDCDILLIYKDSEILDTDLSKPEQVWYWTNEYDAQDKIIGKQNQLTGVVAHSKWQANNTMDELDNVNVIPIGYYEEELYYKPELKEEKLCIYASSPDRGLNTLLAKWPKIKEKVPEAKLLVTYKNPDIKQINGVQFLGLTNKEEMDKIYLRASLWLYPCSGVEMFCLTAIKAQVSGVIPVVIPNMALEETVKYGIKTNEKDFTDEAVKLLKNEDKQLRMRANGIGRHFFHTWKNTINMWERLWKTNK